jgi:methionyl-tRNA formyltransferase
MGTPEFAVTALEACLAVGEVVTAITQPDRPKGRGQHAAPPPVKIFSQARGIPVLQPVKIRDPELVERLRRLTPEVCVVAAYGKILPENVLSIPLKGCVNVHASLLPKFRGASPIQWAIAAGEAVSGVCLMKMDAGLDTGPILFCRKVPIGPRETFGSLERRLAALGADLIREVLPGYLQGAVIPTPQPTEGVSHAPQLKKEDGRVDFTRSANELELRIRAFDPWPGSFTTFEGRTLKIHRAELGTGKGAPGEILRAGGEGIEVACAQGSLVLLELQPEAKRRMSATEFLAGHRIEVGVRPFGR